MACNWLWISSTPMAQREISSDRRNPAHVIGHSEDNVARKKGNFSPVPEDSSGELFLPLASYKEKGRILEHHEPSGFKSFL